ncbi:MAG: hypothetical protein IJF02_00355 [Oscillospiraceae bacterium]|nr:hypothetical protein [Oscillospiraceae bacterium]
MAEEMALRSAINGFNRRDVINCIQQINNNHKLQVQILEAQIGELQAENDRLKAQLEAALTKAEAFCGSDTQELETYRRAERTEREARERAARVAEQTESALMDVHRIVDASTERLSTLMDAWTEAVAFTREELVSAYDAAKAIPHEV